jgi:hypothetical protein
MISLKPPFSIAISPQLNKMHGAVLRIIAEIDRCPPEKVCINGILVIFSNRWPSVPFSLSNLPVKLVCLMGPWFFPIA